MSAAFNSWKQYWNNGTCGSLNTGSNAPRVMTCDTSSSSGIHRLWNDLIVADTSSWNHIIMSWDSNRSRPLSSCCCSWVSPPRSRYGNELADGMGVGQPLSMKLKNVHLPHPQPNGDFLHRTFGGGLVLPLGLTALRVGLSESRWGCLLWYILIELAIVWSWASAVQMWKHIQKASMTSTGKPLCNTLYTIYWNINVS